MAKAGIVMMEPPGRGRTAAEVGIELNVAWATVLPVESSTTRSS